MRPLEADERRLIAAWLRRVAQEDRIVRVSAKTARRIAATLEVDDEATCSS